MHKWGRRWLFILLTFLAAGCKLPTSPGTTTLPAEKRQSLPSPTIFPTAQPSPSLEQTASPSATAIPPSPAPAPAVCSPLEGIPLDKLPGAVANPYHPPPLGSDEPHQGIDLAQRRAGDQVALAGLPVHATLGGTVASVIQDRFPFGNAVLIETPLDALPEAWLEQLDLPSAEATPAVHSALTCPPASIPPGWKPEVRSLYLLYAHLAAAPALQEGDPVACGQFLGNIGSSGNALNPHLHFEVRVGPVGARFSSIAHYNTSATLEEMANYCLWSVSGFFHSVDPLAVLELTH